MTFLAAIGGMSAWSRTENLQLGPGLGSRNLSLLLKNCFSEI
jgi:hypothetical protein